LGFFFLHIESQIIDIEDIKSFHEKKKKQFKMTGMLKKLNPSEMKIRR